jgi:hypothetical protein
MQSYFTSTRCPDFADSKPQREARPLSADGQAGYIAGLLLHFARNASTMGIEHQGVTLQRVTNAMLFMNKISNCPDRRLREAVKWLEREGCEVIKEWVKTDTSRYMRWRVVWNAAAENALAKLEQQKA